MSIQRWNVNTTAEGGWQIMSHDDGEWVRYDDHVAALAEARADERQQARRRVYDAPILDYTDGPGEAFVLRLDVAMDAAGGDAA